ncbi:MAG TPA: DUF1629 domain-containing protein [Mucilaginibacter sp.]|jgi:hypothetical protein
MKYYTFEPACDTKETGPVYPQIQKWKPGYDSNSATSFYSYLKKSKDVFADFIPNLDGLIVNGRARPTDLVSSFTSGGFIVSEKLKLIFEKHNLAPHRFYPAKVIYKSKNLEGYFWMHVISNLTDFIDYSDSAFVISKHFDPSPIPIKLISKENYLEKAKSLEDDYSKNNGSYLSIKSEKLKLDDRFDRKLDFFTIGNFDNRFYISQDLRDSIIENHITGCDIKPANHIMI